MLVTPFTEVFGVEQPIMCGGTPATATAELVAAVADAGALGYLGAPNELTPEGLARQVARCRELTKRPFGFQSTGGTGEEESDALASIAAAAHQLTVPVIADERLADGRGLVAALALGASAINIGTRFLIRSRGRGGVVASCGEVVARIVDEAEDIITGRLADLVRLPGAGPRERRLRAEPASETKLETATEAAP